MYYMYIDLPDYLVIQIYTEGGRQLRRQVANIRAGPGKFCSPGSRASVQQPVGEFGTYQLLCDKLNNCNAASRICLI